MNTPATPFHTRDRVEGNAVHPQTMPPSLRVDAIALKRVADTARI
jgi:hypothetical protein